MKNVISIFSMVVLTLLLMSNSGCNETSDRKLNRQQESLMDEAVMQVGMPAIKNFQERKLAKMIFELRDQEDLICYAYIKSDYNGKLVFLGKCVGYGLPYSIQYTNPEKYYINGTTLPQADPNGLFMPTGLSATWLLMIDPETNEQRPVYVEPEIVVSPFKLQ